VSLSRLLLLAAVVAFAAYQVPKFAPQLLEHMASDPQAAAETEQAAGPAQIIKVAPPAEPVSTPVPETPQPPRKIAAGNSSGGAVSAGSSGKGGVTLTVGQNGHYSTAARINGVSVDVMVDTGASFIAITEETARRLSLSLSPSDFTATMNTANGVVAVAPVMLKEVRIGSVAVRQVQAVVFPGKVLATNLLGMSFLGRLSRFTVGNDEMVLRQ
jgi:aspartyl protease family protein